ncbi:MAG: response regulator [Bacteroidetes bacterium]|jgi:two-component system response regulator|nr:response regulator [Bacteroidota bacterium]
MTTLPDTEILLVEDDPQDADLTMHTLRRHGLTDRLTHVTDGVEAWNWLEAYVASGHHSLRLVLLDLKMPRLGGVQVLDRMKSHPGMRRIPVVVMTSSQQEADLISCYDLGVNSYIVKPLQFVDFSRVVAGLGQYWIELNTTLASR